MDGVQLKSNELKVDVTSQELPIKAISQERIGEVRKMLDDHGLEVLAVSGDLSGHRFCIEDDNPACNGVMNL